jgi:outer membrane receptor protein involved in Fe transport
VRLLAGTANSFFVEVSVNPRFRLIFLLGFLNLCAYTGTFTTIRGVVHDPSHRPVAAAEVNLRAKNSDFSMTTQTNPEGEFQFNSVAPGEYLVTVKQPGFGNQQQVIAATSNSTPVVHFQLQLAQQNQSVTVAETPESVNPASSTATTMVSRQEIMKTPGADLSNSLNMITNFVPGAYMTHDQLHVRGGHQVTWAIDGVPVPNTNIAGNVGSPIDPKDIDTLEVQRGGYSAEYGDRTYGVFNVVPRTGFESNRTIELNTTIGSFYQTNDQVNFGNHTQRFAYFGSITGNRSDYGLETPGPDILHDRVWGLGGFGSIIFNVNSANQLRFVASTRSDTYQIPNTPDQTAAGIRDIQRERDVLSTFTWVYTFSPGLLFSAAPYIHFNRANYNSDPNDTPVSTTQHLDSTYAGAQIALNLVNAKYDAHLGVYGFGQHDYEYINLIANDPSSSNVSVNQASSGHLEALFLEDQFKLTSWFTLTGGVRLTHFSGAISENVADPRAGVALRIPHLNWILRGFYGAYYQAPPLTTVSGPVLDFAVSQGLGIIPLHSERDEENQVGITVPLHGWTVDVNSFRMRAKNFFDHNPVGNSNIFFPVSIAGARIWGEEVTLHSPRLFHRGEVTLAYSHQHAEAEGAISGGLTDFSPPHNGYFLLDHDQRHTLHANFEVNLPHSLWAAGGLYYGSGFTDGSSDVPAHLQPHTTFDLSLGKSFGEKWSMSVNGLNLGNRRFLQDNSLTFGGTHYAEPRQIWLQLRYRFHY